MITKVCSTGLSRQPPPGVRELRLTSDMPVWANYAETRIRASHMPVDHSRGGRRARPSRARQALRERATLGSSRSRRPYSMAQRKLDVVLDSVKRLLRVGATANLVNLLQKQHPADLAQVFAELPDKDRQSAFSLLVERNSRLGHGGAQRARARRGAALLAGRSAEEIGKLLQELPSDDAAAIIDYLPEDVSASVLELMQKRPAGGDVGELLEYSEQTAGRIMNPRVFALAEDMTAAEAITALQGSRDVEMVFYLYVIDARRHLVGVVSLRRLLLVPPGTPLKRIMTTDLISARVDTDQEEVARQVASYNLLAIPVVDEENKLVGVITVDDVIDVIKDEATEDVYRLAGVTGDDRVFTRPSNRCASGCRGCRSTS